MVGVVSLQGAETEELCRSTLERCGKKKKVMKQEMFLTESLTNFIMTFSDGKTVRFKVLLLKPTVLVTLIAQSA